MITNHSFPRCFEARVFGSGYQEREKKKSNDPYFFFPILIFLRLVKRPWVTLVQREGAFLDALYYFCLTEVPAQSFNLASCVSIIHLNDASLHSFQILTKWRNCAAQIQSSNRSWIFIDLFQTGSFCWSLFREELFSFYFLL